MGRMFHRKKQERVTPAPPDREHRRTPSGWHQEDWESYDHVADAYARVSARRSAPAAADLVSIAGVEAGHRVLDVGTGTGVAAGEALGAGATVVGIDPAPKMLAHARAAHPEAAYVIGEALDLPFRPWSFDRVIGNFVVLHFTRYETALFDMARVLREGGVMALSSWAAGEDAFGAVWRATAESLIGKELFRDAARRGAPWREHFSDPARFEQTLKDAGLKRIRTEQRSYRFDLTIESYLEGMETRSAARALHRVMGDAIWERFRAQVREEFGRRFRDPIGDTRDVWFGVGMKP